MELLSMRVVSGVALLALCTASAESQTGPPALVADIETTYALANGRQITVSGHFYRSLDGQEREDSPGGATIVDPRNGTVTLLDDDTQEAMVFTVSHPTPPGSGTSSPAPYDQGIHDGLSVRKTRVEGANGDRREFWMATDIWLVVFSRSETARLTTTKELRNVRLGDPDPALFTVPEGYTVTQQTVNRQD